MSPTVLKRIAIALVVVLAAWGSFALFGSAHRDEAGHLVLARVAPTEVSGINFRKGRDTLVFSRDGAHWWVNGLRASDKSVATFLKAETDTTLRSEIVAQNRASHARMGVDSVTGRRLTIEVAGKPAVDLWLGNRGPDFEGFYVRPVGSDVVYLLRGFFADLTAQSLDDWRMKEFVTLPADTIGQVDVTRGKVHWALARSPQGWVVGGKVADSVRVARFLAQFAGLRAEGFPDSTEMDSISFARPARLLKLSSRDGRPLVSLVFDSSRAGAFWVREAAGGPIYRVDPRVADQATPEESTLRK
jgi:Domain of unknown function (DUF4340)